MVDISPEEWAIWREDKVTQAFFRLISEHREEALKVLSRGHYSSSPSKTNMMVGAINAYTNVMEVKYEVANDN